MPRELVITIEENGDQTLLATDGADIFLETAHTVTTRRASHVEPVNLFMRVAFYVLRACVSDKHAVAQWTRGWPCMWRVNTSPVGGPILRWKHLPKTDMPNGWSAGLQTVDDYLHYRNQVATWRNRRDAIEAEVKFLNEYFGERTI